MDAEYLNKNVSSALSDVLTAMLVASPEDKIEYIAKGLLQYVERRNMLETLEAQRKRIEEIAKEDYQLTQVREMKLLEEKHEVAIKESEYPKFLDSLISESKSKQDAMNLATSFISSYYNIPGCYIALKKVAGETESLNYYAANASQTHVIGKKIMKPTEEGDEAPSRQGLSFDAFKIPEVPEDEEPQLDADGNPIPKPTPLPVPVIVDNVMREKRIKFFGIPKLGSFAAIPLSFDSIDHENGAVPPPEGSELPPDSMVMNKMKQDLIIGCDTIGNFRRFTELEISKVQEIGNAMVSVFKSIEEKLFADHVAFVKNYKDIAGNFSASVSTLPDAEAAALSQVASSLAIDPAIEPPPEPHPESLKPFKDAEAIIQLWNGVMSTSPVKECLEKLSGYVLPAPQQVSNLFYAVALMTGYPIDKVRDICGDITWSNTKQNILPELASRIAAFDCSLSATVNKDTSIAGIKSFIESTNLFDAATYPPTMPVLVPLSQWLQKAIAARESSLVYHKEVKGTNLEVF